MQDWTPINAAHAIQQVNATIRFHGEIPVIPWRKLQSRARLIGKKLGLSTESTVNQFKILTPDGNSIAQSDSPEMVGLEFLRLERPDFFSDKLVVQRNLLSYENWRYTRWVAYSEILNGLLIELAPIFLELVPIEAISLEYIDVFHSTKTDGPADLTQVIQSDSAFVAQAAYRALEPFHCHIGYFDAEISTDRVKTLTQVDIDVADVPIKPLEPLIRAVRIRTNMADLFSQSPVEPPEEPLAQADVAERFDRLHIELKKVLESVLSADAVDAISLKG